VGANIFTVPIQYQELYLRINADNTVSSLTPAATRTNLGLGATNNVTFSNITADGILTANDSTATPATNAAAAQGIQWSGLGGSQHAAIYGGYPGTAQIALAVGASSNALSDVATFRSTGMTVSSNAVVGGTLAVTGNVTMSGVGNTAPSQTASSASSLMTRELSDFRLFGQLALLDQIRSDMGTVHSTNGGGGAIDVNGFDLTTSTNSASSSLYRGYFGSKQTLSGTGGNTVWQGRVVAAWSFNRFSTNVEVRMQFGRNASVTNHGPLDERGMGIRVNGNNMFFETHDGTTLFETTNAVALTHNFGPDVFWAVSESGVARFYRGESTLLATVTNNVPTTFSAATQRWVISISNTSTVSSGFRVRANPGYILQQ
jgi:hypothetical protein